MSKIPFTSNYSSSMITKAELKQLSECQVLEMFDEANHNVFDLAKKYHNEGYDIVLNCFRQDTSSDTGNNPEKTMINHQEQSLLHYACEHKNYDIIKFLIELGFDANSTDSTLMAYLIKYVTSPFPESTPISEQIETDNLVLNLLRNNLNLSDEYGTQHLDFIERYLNTKSINHQIPTVSLLITILQEHREALGDDKCVGIFNSALLVAINCHLGKDIIFLLLPHCDFQNEKQFSNKLLPLIHVADKLIPVSEVSSGKLIHGVRLVIMDGEVEHSTLITDRNVQPKHIEVIIRQFEARKSYLSTHTLTLSKTQQINMISATMEGDFSVAIEFDKQGYDILSSYNSIYLHFCYNVMFYACLHDRLDLMQEFIDKGTFLFFINYNQSMLSEYIIHTTNFNPEVATFLIDNGIDIHYTNPILQYYHQGCTLLPDDMVVYFKQQGFSFRKCPFTDVNVIFDSLPTPLLYSDKSHFINLEFLLQLRNFQIDFSSIDSSNFLNYLLHDHFKNMDHSVFKYNMDCLIRMGVHIESNNDTNTHHPNDPFLIRYIALFEQTTKSTILEDAITHLVSVLQMMYLDVQYLISCGFNVNAVLNDANVLFCYFGVLVPYLNHSTSAFNIVKVILELLVDSKADVNYENKAGKNLPSHYLTIIKDPNPYIVHLLFDLGFLNLELKSYLNPLLCSITEKVSHYFMTFLIRTESILNIINTIITYLVYTHSNMSEPSHRFEDKYYFDAIPHIFHKLILSIDYSIMYSYEDYLQFAIDGCKEIDQYSKAQNATIMYYYRRIMQLLTRTTNRQHQVRRLKKHLVYHNKSLTHSNSITSVRNCMNKDYSVAVMLHERYYNTALVLHPVDHTSMLMYAAKHGFVPLVRWAICLGTNVNAVDRKGMTALMYCCKYSQKYEVIEILLWHGADVGVKWKRKYTAFDMLYRNGVE